MDKSMLKKMTSSGKIKIIDNSLYINVLKKNSVLAELKERNASSRLINFLNEFAGISVMIKIDKNMYQYFEVNLPQISEIDLCGRTVIGRIVCGAQKISVYFDGLRNESFFSNGNIIAQSEEELFKYFMSENCILSVIILSETKQYLEKYGWYEGRSIDVNEIAKKFDKDGTPISNAQKAFLQEFGGIKGFSTNRESFEIYDRVKMLHYCSDTMVYHKRKTPTTDDACSYSPINVIAYQNNVDMLCIGIIGNGMVPLWISTDGKLFADQGTQLGRTVMEGMQTILLS